MGYRSGVAGLAELDAERGRLVREQGKLGRLQPAVAAEVARLWAQIDAPLTSAVDVRERRAALGELDTVLVCALLNRGGRWRRLMMRGGFVGAGLVLLIPMQLDEAPTGCAYEDGCPTYGACVLVDEMCVPTETAHCARSERCKDWGACSLVGQRCEPTGVEECEQSEGCRLEQTCVLGFSPDASCVKESEISESHLVPGKRPLTYRTREVARARYREASCLHHNECE